MKFPRLPVVVLCACLAIAGGCTKNIQNQDAIRQGVMNYLAKRSDLLAMDVSVGAVEFRGSSQATATVHFQAKGNNSPGAGMTMQYVLERKGNDWVVKGRAGENAAHGANAVPPGGAVAPPSGSLGGMPTLPGQAGGGAGSLPPGHPAIGSGNGQALPPGHPAVSPGAKDQQK